MYALLEVLVTFVIGLLHGAELCTAFTGYPVFIVNVVVTVCLVLVIILVFE